MKIILVAGKARSGKTLVAKYLKEKLTQMGKKVAITEYSKYIKLFAKELTDWDGYSEPKPRKFLQDFGYFVRHESKFPNYFIERMKEDISIYEQFVDVLIISDVRLPLEIEMLEEYHPIKIHIANESSIYDLTEEEKNHETEIALENYSNFDYDIRNKTEEEIKKEIETIILKEGI